MIGIASLGAVAAIDVATGPELTLANLYLIPIGYVSWCGGWGVGVVSSAAGAAATLSADYISGQTYSYGAIRYWNAFARFSMFLVVAILLPLVRELEGERNLARLDSLTGADNRRSFMDALQRELQRCKRYKYPLTVAFIDIDDFKNVNDALGHSVGDEVLLRIVRRSKETLRAVDMVARVGGDEFAVLLPQTSSGMAPTVIGKLQAALLDDMRVHHWPVTFSIGSLTCLEMPQTPDDLMREVDELMYAAKHSGKNHIRYGEHPS